MNPPPTLSALKIVIFKFISRHEIIHRFVDRLLIYVLMDRETTLYIKNHFSKLITGKESLANHCIYSAIISQSAKDFSNLYTVSRIYREIGWLTKDEDALDLVKLGEEGFDLKVAQRILSEHKDKVFMNYCPTCGRLARTPYARQCRYCSYDWH